MCTFSLRAVACFIAILFTSAAASAQTVQVIDVDAFPRLDLVVDVRDAGLEAVVAASNVAMRDTLEAGASRADQSAWQERRAAAIQALSERARSLTDADHRRVAAVLVAFVTEDTVARSPDATARHRSAMRTSMTNCGAITQPELHPWAERCRALADYWTAMESWRAGPQWPSACEPERATRVPSSPSGTPTVAVVLASSGTSLRPAAETRRLRAAVIEAVRGWLPLAHVLSVDDMEAAERAYANEQALDGATCLSGDFASAIERAHARAWFAHVSATCPPHGQTGTCRLALSFWASHADPELPPDREIDLGVAHATVDELASAVARLDVAVFQPPIRTGRFGVATSGGAPTGRLWGFSETIEATRVVGVVAPAQTALRQCRDLDASPPGDFDAALEIARNGRVIGVTLTARTRGARRRACVERVFRTLRFPSGSERTRTAIVSGSFGVSADPQVSLRISSPPGARIAIDARSADALIACHPTGAVEVVTVDAQIDASGAIVATVSGPTSPLGECVARAMSSAVTTCGAPQRAPVTVCIGTPVEVPRPVRP